MIISLKQNFIFYHIPKTAGSSVLSALQKYNDIDIIDFKNKVPKETQLHHINRSLVENLLKLPENLLEFTVVRNPLDRLISLYKFTQKYKNFPKESFSKFIQKHLPAYYDTKSYEDIFFGSQLNWITAKVQIIKFEELIKDPIKSLNDIGISIDYFPHENQSTDGDSFNITNDQKDFCLRYLEKEYKILNYKG